MDKCFEKHSFGDLSTIKGGVYRDAITMMDEIFHFDRENGLFVDAGSTCASFVKTLRDFGYTTKNIHCFEPHPILAQAIKDIYPDITVNEYCVGDKDETIVINIPMWSTCHSSIINTKSICSLTDQEIFIEQTPCVTLDTYALINNIKNIDFLKISVNGYEKNVLFGANNLLEQNMVKSGIFTLDCMEDGQYTEDDIIQYLAKNNYKIYRLRDRDIMFVSLIRWKELRK